MIQPSLSVSWWWHIGPCMIVQLIKWQLDESWKATSLLATRAPVGPAARCYWSTVWTVPFTQSTHSADQDQNPTTLTTYRWFCDVQVLKVTSGQERPPLPFILFFHSVDCICEMHYFYTRVWPVWRKSYEHVLGWGFCNVKKWWNFKIYHLLSTFWDHFYMLKYKGSLYIS